MESFLQRYPNNNIFTLSESYIEEKEHPSINFYLLLSTQYFKFEKMFLLTSKTITSFCVQLKVLFIKNGILIHI